MRLGCHLSAAKGYLHMAKEAASIGANTFQFFTRNPRGGSVKQLDEADLTAYLAFAAAHDLTPPLAHAPYTVNPCGEKPEVLDFALRALGEDLDRLERLPGCLYNLHPGSHVGQGAETGIQKIADTLNAVMTEERRTPVLLETMAGKGSEVGRTFQELRAILDRAHRPERLGICLDTCHVFDGGYDIVNDLDRVLEEFDRTVGLDRLRAVHLNDSKNPLGSRKDRHACLGEGFIGWEALEHIVTHPALRHLPFYLETPQPDLMGYGREIAAIKERIHDHGLA